MNHAKSAVLAVAVCLSVVVVTGAGPVSAHPTGSHDNCTKLNQKWSRGVGIGGAVDKTSGVKVINFSRNSDGYRRADKHNGTLDPGNDGIACEKR